jgi:hypothetical protein
MVAGMTNESMPANADRNERVPKRRGSNARGAERVCLRELLTRFPWLTERRVRSMVAERRVPYWKFEGRLLFDPADIQALLDAGYVEPVMTPPERAEGPR